MCRTLKGGSRRVSDSGRLPRNSRVATAYGRYRSSIGCDENIGNPSSIAIKWVCTSTGVSQGNPHLERVSRPGNTMPTHWLSLIHI